MSFDTTIGARSGAERTTPVMGWSPGQDGSWLIVAAPNGGARIQPGTTTSPHTPTRSRSRRPGGKVAVIADQLHGTERDDAWRQIRVASRRFAKYQRKTDRELPIIRLTPRPA